MREKMKTISKGSFLKIVFVTITVAFAFLLLANINTNIVIAQTSNPPIVPSITPEATKDNIQFSTLTTELDYMKEFNNKLLTTFFAALGFVAVFLVVFLGMNWVTNNQKVEQQMKLVKEKLLLDQEKNFEEIRARSSSVIKALTQKYDYDISRLKYDIHIIEAESAESRGVLANALTAYLDAVNCCPDHGAIAYTLQKINGLVKDERTNFHADDYSNIATAIDKTKNNEILVAEIRENMRNRKK